MIELYEHKVSFRSVSGVKNSARAFDWKVTLMIVHKMLISTSNKQVYYVTRVSGIFASGSDHPAMIDCEGDCEWFISIGDGKKM